MPYDGLSFDANVSFGFSVVLKIADIIVHLHVSY